MNPAEDIALHAEIEKQANRLRQTSGMIFLESRGISRGDLASEAKIIAIRSPGFSGKADAIPTEIRAALAIRAARTLAVRDQLREKRAWNPDFRATDLETERLAAPDACPATTEEVEGALAQLSPKLRRYAWAHLAEGERLGDIASREGVTKQAVSHGVARALEKMRAWAGRGAKGYTSRI